MFWKLIPVLPFISFSMSTVGLINGDYSRSGLPEDVIPLHIWINGVEALGWVLALWLVLTGRNGIASKLAFFLAGMWFWDMVTTIPLEMPVPPLQIIWGPVSVLLLVLFAYEANQAEANKMKVF